MKIINKIKESRSLQILILCSVVFFILFTTLTITTLQYDNSYNIIENIFTSAFISWILYVVFSILNIPIILNFINNIK